MPMEVYDYRKSAWSVAAKRHLEQALDDLLSGIDPIPETDAALACLRMEVGELPKDEELLEPEDRRAVLDWLGYEDGEEPDTASCDKRQD